MKKSHRARIGLIFTVVLMATSLLSAEKLRKVESKPLYFWGGLQLGAIGTGARSGGGAAVLGWDLSVQVNSWTYGSVYGLSGSEPFGSDALSEFGLMFGRCTRTKGAFAGAATGLGWMSGWIGGHEIHQVAGVPLKLEGALIIGPFLSIGLQLHAFFSRETYSGLSLAFQLGKLR